MTRRQLLKRLIAVAFIPATRITTRYDRPCGLFNPRMDVARQYRADRLAFHPRAFEFVMADLPLPAEFERQRAYNAAQSRLIERLIPSDTV